MRVLKLFPKFLLGVILFLSSSLSYAAWTEQVVDNTTNTQFMSLDIDSNGFVHISYEDSYNGVLKYASFNGTGWNLQVVDSEEYVGSYTSLSLNAQGYARISYYDSGGTNLKYASYNGIGWTLQTVDGALSDEGEYTSLELNSQGYARISYRSDSGEALKYASFNGTGWDLQTIDNTENVGYYTSIALNSSGYAGVSYFDVSNTQLKYASFNGTGWVTQTIDTDGANGWDNSVTFNAQGYAQISYKGNDALRFASFNGSGWVIQTIDSGGIVGYQTSLALNSQGYAYISYIEEILDKDTTYNLKLAYFNGTGWEIQTLYANLASLGGLPTDTALHLFNDYVYVTFANNANDLITATNAPEGFVPEPAMNILGKILLFGLPVFIMRQRKRN